MADYEIDCGRPPRHSRFKKCVCGNPSGRLRRFNPKIGDAVRGFLSGEARYREKGGRRSPFRRLPGRERG